MKKGSFLLALAFFITGMASEGLACASFMRGQKSCCTPCVMKLIPKMGNSCCVNGIQGGGFVANFPSSSKISFVSKVLATFTGENRAYHSLENTHSFKCNAIDLYILEEHLLI